MGARILPFGAGFFLAALGSAFLGQRQGKPGALLGLSLQAASMLTVVQCVGGVFFAVKNRLLADVGLSQALDRAWPGTTNGWPSADV
ncbi:hypothetical protein PspR76_12055 [Pseudomonas sp. R76]|nr:hypothetical protein PspR76_12055 [Pseudomonas sp. R76]